MGKIHFFFFFFFFFFFWSLVWAFHADMNPDTPFHIFVSFNMKILGFDLIKLGFLYTLLVSFANVILVIILQFTKCLLMDAYSSFINHFLQAKSAIRQAISARPQFTKYIEVSCYKMIQTILFL